MIIDFKEFLSLRNQLPIADVRSESEFNEGHICGANNIPLLNDQERKAVGTDYKLHGQLEAIKTGFRLVGPRLSEIIDKAEQIATEKELLVHCWRGGMRSFNFCQFVAMAQIKTLQLRGGYKTYRQSAFETFKNPLQFVVIGGCTGSGKSEVLRTLAQKGEQIIDLESLANHKGSVFGGLMMPPQPTTEQFQNNLFEEILKLDINRRIWIEDESIAVGKIFLPDDFWRRLRASPVVELKVNKDKRIERLAKEYGCADREEFLHAMRKITKKLGGQHFNTARDRLMLGDMEGVIDVLLTYYDKAYQNGLANRTRLVNLEIEYDGDEIEQLADRLVEYKFENRSS